MSPALVMAGTLDLESDANTMSFLPLVQRELRAAARRKSTFRIRSWTVLVAMFATFSCLVFVWLSRRGASVGASLFSFLSSYAFCLCLLAGLLFTADCLSQEKREGTLGLLFLTNLKGYDVVLGKFCAASLNAFYGLLALLPFLAFPLLLGGVTGNEFGRMALALINALFFSLAIGMCASAFVREAQRATGVTLAILLVTAVVVPILAKLSASAGLTSAWSWISPFCAFSSAAESTFLSLPQRYWVSLAASHLVGWVNLALASLTLPRRWQSSGTASAANSGKARWSSQSQSDSGGRAERRRTLLELNPVAWLASPNAGLGPIAWLVVLLWGIVVLALSLSHIREAMVLFNGGFGTSPFGGIATPFGFLLKALCAVQAARFFTEARREGVLETLLCAPLTSRDLVAGQSLALRRLFGPAVATFIVVLFFPGLLQLITSWATLDIPRLWSGAFSFFLSLVYCVRLVADLVAVSFVAMWLALSLKKPNYAPVLTILYVLVLPSFLCWLDVFADFVFIGWASARLQSDLRWVLSRQYTVSTSPATCPPVIANPSAPPVTSS